MIVGEKEGQREEYFTSGSWVNLKKEPKKKSIAVKLII
jgi:hypothetical protein